MLLVGHEDLSLCGALWTPHADVAGNADDRHELQAVETALDAMADRIPAGERSPRQRLIDDGDVRRLPRIAFREVASALQRDPHGLEVFRRHDRKDRLRRLRDA